MWEVKTDYICGQKIFYVCKGGSKIGTFDDEWAAQEFADSLNARES